MNRKSLGKQIQKYRERAGYSQEPQFSSFDTIRGSAHAGR